MTKEKLAARLKELRRASGLTAKQVGNMLGKSEKTVSGWENNRSQPDAETLIKLCDIYRVKDILETFEMKEKAPDDEAQRKRLEAERKQLLDQIAYLMDQMTEEELERFDQLTQWATLPKDRYTMLARIAEIISEQQ